MKKTDLHIYVTPATKAAVDKLAESMGVSSTAVVQLAINDYLKRASK